MFGHGRPTLSQLTLALSLLLGLALLSAISAARTAPEATAETNAPTLRLRIAWGGDTPEAVRQWQGAISLSAGSMRDPRPLGIEADEPGSMSIVDGRLRIQQRSPRAYDGVDLSIDAPLDAVLTIALSATSEKAKAPVEVRLADLVSAERTATLDDRGNRLLVRRTPGDTLRVQMQHSSLVFSPGDTLQLQVQPHLLSVPAGTQIQVRAELSPARASQSLWSQEFQTTLGDEKNTGEPISIGLEVPQSEGVYDLTIKAIQQGLLKWNSPWNKPLAERRVQFVVVGRQSPAGKAEGSWAEVTVIDPANPRWWERLKLSRIPGLQRAPLGSGDTLTWQHPLGQLMQLGPGGRGSAIAWEAYSLPVSKPGLPHIVEVEYPSDVAQTLGISVIEPNAAGTVAPIGLDSGVYSSGSRGAGEPRWEKHRLVFWPRTKTPLLLLSNRRDGSMAAYGKIRLLAGPKHLPRLLDQSSPPNERLLAGYFSRPLFAENFSATETLDRRSNRSLEDWQTFYEGATRLVEYMNYTGQNAMVVTLFADGSSIFPSQVVEPTPRYDTGVFFDVAQDPLRKDIAELLFRLFDREEAKLIPALRFSSPLPRLEAELQRATPDVTGIRLVGADGLAWLPSAGADRGVGAHYNPLDPRVQKAMLEVVREVAVKYGKHPSFAGLALDMSAAGYAQLPGEQWAIDDTTFARFLRDTKVEADFSGPQRYAQRAALISAPGAARDQWLAWRSEIMADLHCRMADELKAVSRDAILFLAGAETFDDPHVQRDLRPALPSGRAKFDDLLARTGIKPVLYDADSGVVLLRPQRLNPPAPLAAEAVDLQINSSAELDRQLSAFAVRGSLLVHEPQKARLESFDAKSPFGPEKTYTWLVSQMSPSGPENRRRFVHSMATLDSTIIVDGGWMLTLGQEESIRDFALAYRRLPAASFSDVLGDTQPVAIRSFSDAQHTYVYFVNDSDWAVTVSTSAALPAGCTMEELSGERQIASPQSGTWSVPLEPFDFLAVRFSNSAVVVSEPRLEWRGDLRSFLTRQVRDLGARVASIAAAPPLPWPSNANFDQPPSGSTIPGWLATSTSSSQAKIDPALAASGTSSVLLTSSGPIVSLRSEPFEAPTTGRLELEVKLRVQDTSKQPPLRLAIEGVLDGSHYYKFGEIKAPVAALTDQWKPYVFRIDDLPAQGLSELRVRFDLMGPGEVWIDDVQLFDLQFLTAKHRELLKIVASADSQLSAGNLGDCLQLLDSYWPRYLQANVPLAQLPVAPAEPEPAQEPERAAEKAGMFDRIRGMFRR